MRKTGIIFDFDGVIINSYKVQEMAYQEVYDNLEKEYKPTFQDFLSHSGNSLKNIFDILGIPQEMIKLYVDKSRELINEISLHSDMEQLLIFLNSHQASCALLTGKESMRTYEILNKFKLKEHFQEIVCSDQLSHAKPHPEGVKICTERMGKRKEEMLIIGDAVNDIKCGKNAGITTIAVLWGEGKKEDFVREDADFIVSDKDELQELLRQLM